MFSSNDLIAVAIIKTSFGICNIKILDVILKASEFVAEAKPLLMLRLPVSLSQTFLE
jgi:hypothetical protein